MMLTLAHCLKYVFAISFVLISLAPLVGAQPQPEAKILRHVVSFRFKETTSQHDIKKIEDAFRALPSKIHEIRSFEWGTNVSKENLSQGYTHCFILTFASDKDRDAYLVHPAHKEFGNIIGDALDKVFVVDFWAQK